MIGGAFLSAAITKPRNCLIAISLLWATVIEWFIIGTLTLTLIIVVGVMLFSSADIGAFAPFIWFGAAHIGWFGLLLLCRRIAERIEQYQAAEDDPKHDHR